MKTILPLFIFLILVSSPVSAQNDIGSEPPAEAQEPQVPTETKKAEVPTEVASGVKVKMDYTLIVEGRQVETSKGGEPLEYTHGMEMIIKGLEEELEGMKVGESKTIMVSPEDGYGAVVPEMVVDLPKSKLQEGVVPEKGMMLQFPTQDGQMIVGTVLEVMENDIKVDFNHPLAGKELKFEVTIVSLE